MSDVKCGVYKIECSVNKKVYVGSSKDIMSRWKSHKRLLKGGKHHSAKLQRAWNKYGKESGFVFEILEECEQTDLFKVEQYWYDKLESYENGYNSGSVVNAPINNISWDVRLKFETEYASLVESLYEFSLRDGVFPEETQVSFYGVSIPTKLNSRKSLNRFKRVVDVFTEIIDFGDFMDSSLEYRLKYVEISPQESSFSFIPEYYLDKGSKYKPHAKNKMGNLYKELYDFIWNNIKGMQGGKHVKKCFDKYMNEIIYEG